MARVLDYSGPVTTIGFSTDTDVREDRRTVPTDDGDHERFSHYVEKDKLTEAMVMGTPMVALCGKEWVPSRAPEKFPVCPECKEFWESMNDDSGEDAYRDGPTRTYPPPISRPPFPPPTPTARPGGLLP